MKNYPLPLFSSIAFLAIGISTTLFAFAAHADEAADKNAADAASEQKLVIKPGDKVYFKLTDVSVKDAAGKKVENPILTLWQRQGESSEEIAIPSKTLEVLLTYDPAVSYQLDVKNAKKEDARCIQSITSANFFKPLNDKIQQHPNDRKKWTVVFTKGTDSVTLSFAGIQRFYELKSVSVPGNSKHRDKERYKAGKPVVLRVYIDKDGEQITKITAPAKAWEIDYPSSSSNRWEVREGMGENYLIRLRDANTTFYEIFLLDVRNITDKDFAELKVVEKLDEFDTKNSEVKLYFRLLDE